MNELGDSHQEHTTACLNILRGVKSKINQSQDYAMNKDIEKDIVEISNETKESTKESDSNRTSNSSSNETGNDVDSKSHKLRNMEEMLDI